MMRLAMHVVRAMALFAALWLSKMVAGWLLWSGASTAAGSTAEAAGGADALPAAMIITSTYAAVLAWLAARSRLSRAGRFALVFALYFIVRAVMTNSEVLFFRATFDLEALDMPRVVAMEAIVALGVAATAAAIYPVRRAGEPILSGGAPASAWAWRLAATAGLYVLAYTLAGTLIAWTSPAVREFYGEDAGGISVPALLGFQVLRGLVWSGLVVLVLASHKGALLERALAAATAVTVILAAMLLSPSDFMPEAVARRHLIEIAVSNMAWGLVASFLLAPLTDGSPRRRGGASAAVA